MMLPSHEDPAAPVDRGQAVLSGASLDLFHGIDRRVLRWAAGWAAADHRFPPFLRVRDLQRIDYFHSFPHLATFPACLDRAPDNLESFAAGRAVGDDGCLAPAGLEPLGHVMAPAACYHVYVALADRSFDAPRYITTAGLCCRREAEFHPLERQWAFTMREIVCIGTAGEVEAFLSWARKTVMGYGRGLNLSVGWEQATDPFFRPARDPKCLYQKLEPVKSELRTEHGLAIASVNHHRDTFGRAFGLSRDGQPACTGCVAFGLERWVAAVLDRHGNGPEAWPDPEAFRD